jgi:Flp pilus assembly CpaE family ATPase
VLLVTTNELASLHAAQRALLYLDSQRMDMKKVKLVVNRYQKESGLMSENFREAFSTEVFQIVPADNDAVQRSLMDGKPIQSASHIGKSLTAMANNLVGFQDKASKKSNGKGSLLSSLFR